MRAVEREEGGLFPGAPCPGVSGEIAMMTDLFVYVEIENTDNLLKRRVKLL